MADMLTRADLAKMPPHEIEAARKAGQIDGVAGDDPFNDQKATKQNSRRTQKPRSAMLRMQMDGSPEAEKAFEEEIGSGNFDSILDGATHVLDIGSGKVYDITGTNDDDLSPIVKAQDAAGEDREELAEKLFSQWLPLTGDIYLRAAEYAGDQSVKASKIPLPLKPKYQDAITSGEMVVVDPENGETLLQFQTEKEQKQQADKDAREQAVRDKARAIGRSPAIDGF